MKIAGGRVDRFLKSPDPGVVAVLIYGPNRGLVRERAETIARLVVDDLTDPFRVANLTPARLKDDPACLTDEANGMSLSGGDRVVRLTEATDGLTKAIQDFLKGPEPSALVIIEAGELGPRSSLRRLFEGADNAAAIACYDDDARGLEGVVIDSLSRHGLTVAPDALAYLVENLGSDRLVSRNELEKLALYMGGKGSVDLEAVTASVGDSARASLNEVVYAAAGGNRRHLDQALSRAFSEGVQPIQLLRATARHVHRLHLAVGMTAGGKSPAQAFAALRPPVIFLFKDRFLAQMRQWPAGRLAKAMDLITEAELDCMTTGLPAEAVCGRALMRLAQAARGT